MKMMAFVESNRLGLVLEEMDFRLAPDTVRNPDVAFVTAEHWKKIDLDRSPIDGAPALAIEVISPNNTAQDTVKKIQQFLRAGCRSVWIVYPTMRFVEVHSAEGVYRVQEPETLKEEALLSGFSLSLRYVFDGV
jgi:Uma2 family endonuclease